MFSLHYSYYKTIVLEIVLVAVCLLGDHGPQNQNGNHYIRAMSDNLTHGLVGGVSWSIVCSIQLKVQDILECVMCLVMASFVDVDHFLAAGSFSLKRAVSLPSRPPFHASTLILAIDVILFLLLYIYGAEFYKKLILMFNIAWLSHHIRDATRRGLWLYPFGETPPLSKFTYFGLITCLPLLVRFIYVKWVGQKSISGLNASDDSKV